MLQVYLWVIRLGAVLDQPFSAEMTQRIAKAGEFVYQMQDEGSGRVPCYGQDDGALVIPLNDCSYHDYRPLVQASHFLTAERRRLDSGPWDEDLLWLFGRHAVAAPVDPPSRCDTELPIGGYYTLRSRQGFAFARAGKFRHRPAQADMLHVDIWWRGENIALDPGTYSYNSPKPWDNSLAETKYHNTITVDGRNQMERAGRFIWLPWIKGTSSGNCVSPAGHLACWQGTHDGYRKLRDPVEYCRSVVRLGLDHWVIIDELTGREPHHFCLHWLLAHLPYSADESSGRVELQTAHGPYQVAVASSNSANLSIRSADEESPYGWRSSYYHNREPALAILLQETSSQVTFASLFGPGTSSLCMTANDIAVTGVGWEATIRTCERTVPRSGLVRDVQMTGAFVDSLTVP